MSANIAISTETTVPDRVEVELRLRTLAGADNPLASGGKLSRAIMGSASEDHILAPGSTLYTDESGVSVVSMPSFRFSLQAMGLPLLELELELADYGDDSSQARVEVCVTHKGVAASLASDLPIDSAAYTWRLSGQAELAEGVLKLTFDLVQEEMLSELFDALASTRLAFIDDGSGAQKSTIKVKRSGVGLESPH
jgi:hypothetical protein